MGSSAKSAEWYRAQYEDISGDTTLAAAGGDATLVTCKAGHTIFIQAITLFITTDAAQSLSFEDSNGTPKVIAVVPASPGVNTRWSFEFGGPRGVPLTALKNFVLNVSAAGVAAHIEWTGYMQQTSVEYIPATGTGRAFI